MKATRNQAHSKQLRILNTAVLPLWQDVKYWRYQRHILNIGVIWKSIWNGCSILMHLQWFPDRNGKQSRLLQGQLLGKWHSLTSSLVHMFRGWMLRSRLITLINLCLMSTIEQISLVVPSNARTTPIMQSFVDNYLVLQHASLNYCPISLSERIHAWKCLCILTNKSILSAQRRS